MKSTDSTALARQVRDLLIQRGALPSKEICQELKISQPVFSRFFAKKSTGELLACGKARSRLYAVQRKISNSNIDEQFPLYQINEEGKVTHLVNIIPIEPKGFLLESLSEKITSQIFYDLPFFLDDLRPSGFLGRLIPKSHSELEFSHDIRLWSTNNCLEYWSRYGWNLTGNLIIGKKALDLYLEKKQTPTTSKKDKNKLYPELAQKILLDGNPGSSAGGEQPKFLFEFDNYSALVKFSPPIQDQISQRVSDLLVCELISQKILSKTVIPTTKSELIKISNQTFFQIERFDRTQSGGRLGVISIKALGMEFTGLAEDWGKISNELLRLKKITNDIHLQVQKLQIFGQLIANTDMHAGNLSFYFNLMQVEKLTPVYDMLPMMYYPRANQITDQDFVVKLPSPAQAELWTEISDWALDFWKQASIHPEVSKGFQTIAEKNHAILSQQVEAVRRLFSF